GEKKRFWKYVAPSAVFLLLALTAVWLFHPERKVQALTDKDTIVLADIENRTGDEVFDDALRQALAVELEQSPFLNVISDQKVNETLGMMGLPANQRITEEVGRELCQRVGSKALLIGTISRLGSHYLIGLNAEACRTGDTLAREQGEAATKEDVLKAVSRATASLRNKLGESLPSVQKFDVPVEATTSSLEALRYFDVGLTLRRKEGDAAGLPFLHRSVELDPNFASAYSELALSYDNLEQPSRALEYAGRAYQLRDRATKKEQLSITALYFGATGELDKEMQAYEVWAADYPRSPVPHFNLGADYVLMAHYDRALPELEEALRLAPDNVNIYTGLGSTFLYMNRLDEAKSTFDEALARKLDDGGIRQYMYYLAFLRGDAAQMEEDVSWAAGKPGDEDTLFALQADTEAYHGQMNKEREFTIRAVDSAIRADSRETAAMWKAHAAWCEAEVGNAASARQAVAEALALSRGRDVTVQAALALARSGDESQANSLAEDLRKSYPNDTLLKLYWLPSINAAIDLNNGNASHALSVLEGAAPFDLAEGLALHPAYLRGLAYLQSHNGMAAAAEFQKLLDHKSIVLNFVTGSLAHLQIGRAYAMAGDRAKAKAAYQDFFALWKDADAGSTLLKQAKAEYAKLQ
ncbi:MAG: tetratricopeptide repeat protein, partial [Terracidiphilus sp.]